MKQLNHIIGCLLGIFVLLSCGSDLDPSKYVRLNPTQLTFAAHDMTSKRVTVESNGDWKASTNESWIHLTSPEGTGNGSVSVKVDDNTAMEAREGIIYFSGNSIISTNLPIVTVKQDGLGSGSGEALVPVPDTFDGTKRSSTTYQLLVYSFADSDGDGVGDFKGIENRLDYLDQLGVTALWLSPIHPCDSYHGYDVTDYYAVNPLFGTEDDFKSLVTKAHEKGIGIYIDYVLNHSGKGHPWFQEALANPSSPYRDYYFISTNPAVDYEKFPMLSGTTYKADEWKLSSSGSPKLKISKTTEDVQSGSSSWNLWFWPDGGNGAAVQFKDNGDGTAFLVKEFSGKTGLLLRKRMDWDTGSKFGGQGGEVTLQEGQEISLAAEGSNIFFTGTGRYKIEISNLNTESVYFMGCFSDWMPDLNYGAVSDCENNACFKDLAASADKWINIGIDGFRLDAVKHICGGISYYNNASNRTFLKKWYEHCNATYKAAGHSDNIFMVGEVWSGHNEEKYYYEGLTSCFEFGYWPLLYKALTQGTEGGYVSTVNGFISDHTAIRPDAITSLFMTNHDHASQTGDGEVRAANDLGKNLAKEKQAAAIILTTPGKPFIYQGEELGYWGNSKGKGDEYLRAPIVWDAAATQIASKGVNNKVDSDMLKGSISVETQKADENSLLTTYMAWSKLRNTYPALASGTMTEAGMNGGAIMAWYMTASDGGKLLVVHNVASSAKQVIVSDDMSKPVAVLGNASVKENTTLVLGGNSSVVFKL